MTPAGEALAAWWRSQAGKYVLQLSRRPPEGGFSAPSTVTEVPQEGSPPEIHLAVNPSGDAAVAWLEENEAEKSVVMVSTIPAGGSPSAPWPVSDGAHDAGPPQVAIDDAGQITVVWNGYSTAEERPGVIQASKGSGESFSSPEDVSEADQAADPQLALDPGGEPTVVWVGFEEKPEEEWEDEEIPEYFPPVVEASTAVGGGFDPPIELSDSEEPAFTPGLAIGAEGTTVVAWVRESGPSDLIVQGRARAPGGEFTQAQDLSVEVTEALHPDAAVNRNGVATVVWEGGGTSVIQASIRPPGGPFGAPLNLSVPGNDALFPEVAMDDAGDAAVVWRRSNGSNAIVQVAGYDANPPELRNLSVPSTGTVGIPVSFSVDPFDVWSVSSSGFDFGDGGSAPGSSMSHTYAAPGTYQVTATATDPAGSSTSAGGTISILASNDFRLGKLKRNKRRGTATLAVEVPGPGRLVLSGKGVKRVSKRAPGAGALKLPIKAAGKSARRLTARGKAKLKLKIEFSPEGGPPASQTRTIILKKAKKTSHRSRRR